MNVLSLFDGISIAKLALKNLNIDCTYYASEIDKYCIRISKKHFPEIIRLGDIRNVFAKDLPKIDLLIGGSPCQDLSKLKRSRKGLAGKKSRLFYEYFRLLKECKPKYFLFENVASMDVVERQKISDALKINPILINSSLLTAQFRSRYYWTNIKFLNPKDKKILLSSVIRGGIQTKRSHIVLQLHILLQMKQTTEEGSVK